MRRGLAWMLAVLCLTAWGCGLAAAGTEQIRGYDEDQESDYQYLLFGSYPYEEDGTEAPVLWRILGREGDVITLFTEYIIDVHQVTEIADYEASKAHKYKKGIAFEETDLFAWVNGEMTGTLLKNEPASDALIAAGGGLFHIMTNEEMRRTDWGFPNSVNGNTIENPGEVIAPKAKNRKGYGTPYAKTHILYADWGNRSLNRLFQYREYGNSSPYWTSKMRTDRCGIVGANGHLSWSGFGDVQKGVRPAMLLDLSKLRITGGDGSLEQPWQVAPAREAELVTEEAEREDEALETAKKEEANLAETTAETGETGLEEAAE